MSIFVTLLESVLSLVPLSFVPSPITVISGSDSRYPELLPKNLFGASAVFIPEYAAIEASAPRRRADLYA